MPGGRASFALRAVGLVVVALLGWLYVAGATEHARVMNTSKARGDQSGYLWDAQQVYANWQGREPEMLIGQRMRMPVYAGFLALAYTPELSDDAFFEVGKRWSIGLSLALMMLLCLTFAWHLPRLPAVNLSLVVAFGYFVHKAGYTQPESLFYGVFFLMFLACVHLLRDEGTVTGLALGGGAGVLAGLAYLTKAVVPPLVAMFLGLYAVRGAVAWWRDRRGGARGAGRRLAWRAAAGLAMATGFFAVIAPYIVNSKREFGQYFFNQNTTYYMWYEYGNVARAEMLPFTDEEGRVSLQPDRLPSLGRYWRRHSFAQMWARVRDGLAHMSVGPFSLPVTYPLLTQSLLLYGMFVLAVVAANGRAFAGLLRHRAALAAFLLGYGIVYLPATAFFVPTSSTGGLRFLLAHVAPLLFVLSWLLARRPFSETRWRFAGLGITPHAFHVAVLLLIGYDLVVRLRPRLLATYAGF